MKKILLFLFAVFISQILAAQTVVFHESFELPSGGDSVVTSADSAGFATTNFQPWSLSTHLAKSGVRSDSNRVQTGKTIYLTTNSFSTLGNNFVTLEFAHICKLVFADGGIVEVSNNDGLSWTLLNTNHYLGSAAMSSLGRFSENSYGNSWLPGDSLTNPTATWWRNEIFDISAIAANKSQVKIRFKINDGGYPGGEGRYGWLIDDIKVLMSPSELKAPTLNFATIPSDTVYTAGPYNISVYSKDASGVEAVTLYYKYGNGSFSNLPMQRSATVDSLFTAEIPFGGWGKRVDYYVTSMDSSSAHNTITNPISGYKSFFCKFANGGLITLGNGTSSGNYPFHANWGYTRSAALYQQNEINATGLINQIQWNVLVSGSTVFPIKVYLKDTSVNTLVAGNWAGLINGATLVYDGTKTFSQTGWNTLALTTAFNHNSGNLLVLCESNYGGGGASTSFPTFAYTSTTQAGTHLYKTVDTNPPTTALTLGNTRPNIKINVIGGNALSQDAGIAQIVNPAGGVTANTAFNVETKIKNYGSADLTKASVKFSIDGNAPQTYSWTGNLAKDSVSAGFTAGSLNLPVGGHSLKVWAELPNDSIDQNNINDTAYINFYACASPLSGNYTIGGTNADFATFADALTGLNQCGINGAVVFNINTGTYSNQLILGEVFGSSATNTITFKAANNDSTSVIMNYNASTSTDNWIIKLNGGDNYIFKNLCFAPANSSYSNAIVFANAATNNEISGCLFNGNSGTSNDLASVRIEDITSVNNRIIGNRFNSGSMAVMCKGISTTSLLGNITVKNNILNNFTKYGVYAAYVNKMLVEGNTITSDASATDKYGVYMNYAYDTVKVIRNTINLNGATNTYGILFDNCHATDSTRGLIANNMISITNGTSYAYGIRTLTTDYQKIYFNSVVTNGANLPDTRALNIATSSANIDILNNNLQSNRYPLHVEVNNAGKCNYNNYYATGAVFAKWNTTEYANLQALKTANQKDTNSMSVNPYFLSLNNLHTNNGLLNGKGISVTDVNNDIDGDLRANPPCIGADEFMPPANDATAIALITKNTCGLTSNEDVTLVIKNIGTASIAAANLTATYAFVGANNMIVNAVTPENVNRTIAPGDTVNYIFNAKANLSVAATHIDSTFQLKAWVNLIGDLANANDTAQLSTLSSYTPVAPTVNNFNGGYGSTVTLTANSSDTLYWYNAITGGNLLGKGLYYTTPVLFTSNTYYVEAKASTPALTQIGAGTSTDYYPFYCGYGYSRSASLYKASEIGGNGMISELNWNVSSSASTVIPIKIYLKQTTSNAMTSDTWANLINGATLVYDGTKTFSTTGWNSIPLTTPFNYLNGNLMVLCEANYGGYGSTSVSFYYTTSPSGSHQYQRADSNPPTSALTLNTQRPNIKIKLPLPGCSSPRVAVNVNVAAPPPIDLGTTQITSPVVSVPAAVSQDVNVKIRNYGLTALTSANINYQIDNGTVNTFAWTATTPLAFDSTKTVTVTNMAFAPGLHKIKAWTSQPNNQQDTIAANDTVSSSFLASLHGTYSIGDTTGGVQKDFPSFTSAIQTLSIAGISDAVIFLADTGTYTEQIRIPQIYGADANKTITFRSVNNDSTKVKLQFAATSAANYIVKLDSADYIRFEKMTIKSTASSYGRLVEMSNGANYNVINNCILEMPVTTSSSVYGIYSNGSNHYNTIENNVINNGYYGIYTYGTSTAITQKGNIIRNNKINNYYYYGIYNYYQDTLQIANNTIKTVTSNYSNYGIYAGYNNNSVKISKNTISINSTSTSTYGSLYGIYVYYCTSNAATRNLITNNAISVEGGTSTASIYGLYNYYSNYQNIYYNSVNMISAFTQSRAFYISGGSENRIINNNFANNGGGFAYYSGSNTAAVASDFNNLYTNGQVLAYYNSANRNTLADFKAASSKDVNSQSINPLFNANHNLHLQTTTLSAYATPIAEVTDDIDGELRHLTAPSIGADEFPLYQFDAGVVAILNPAAIDTEAVVAPVKVIVKNFGTDTITTMTVNYKINNGNAVNYTYNGNLASLKTDTISLPNLVIPAGNNSICAYTVLTADVNQYNDQSCKNFFGMPLFDAQVTKVSPINGGCNLTSDTVKIWIKNKGINTINGNISASYKSNSNAVVTQTVNNVIASNDSILLTFNTVVNLTATAADVNYNIKAWATLANDNNHVNDTAAATVSSFYTPAAPVANNVSIPFGTIATLNATSATNAPLYWYDTISGGNKIDTGSVHITPTLYANDTLYVEASTLVDVNATIGTGTSTQQAPFNGNWGYSRSAAIYTANEINGNGNIEKLAWDVSSSASTSFPVKVYLKNVSNSAMTAQTWNDLKAGATLVYDGNKSFNTTGWNEFILSNQFAYNSNSNLMVLCEANFGGSGAGYGNYPNFRYTTGLTGTHQTILDDDFEPTFAGSLSTSRPNIKIYSAPSGCKSPRVPVVINVSPQSPTDAGVIAIVSPSNGVNMSNQEAVTVKIKNYGSTAIQNFAVKYRINNNAAVTEIVSSSIAPNDTMTYTFTQKADLHVLNTTYIFKAFTALTADATALNDTTTKSVTNSDPVYCESKATTTVDEDLGQVIFAGINNGNPLPVLNNANANQTYNDYTSLAPANIQAGRTYPISLSIIFEDNSYTGKVNAYIDYNRNGNWDLPQELAFSAVYDGTNSTVTGNVTVPFNASAGLSRMRIVVDESDVAPACGTYSWGETEDYSVNIVPPIPHDAGIAAITDVNTYLPYNTANTVSPKFVIRNYGSDSLSAATVKYNVNGTINTFNWTKTPALQSLQTDTFAISNIAIQAGMNIIDAYTILAGDTNYMNDTVRRKIFKESLFTVPFADNFDLNSFWYASDTNAGVSINNLWEQGAPAANVINAAHSGSNVWATNLDGNYVGNNISVLYSPKFNMAGMTADTLKFWQWRNFGSGAYGRIEYLNAQSGWVQLGSQNDANASNWYNSANGFDTISNGWELSTYKLNNLSNIGSITQFRFIFTAGATTTPLNGWAIDDFKLSLAPLAKDAGVIAITTPTTTSLVGDTVYPVVTIKNFGTDPLTSIPVKYQVSGGAAVTATWTGNLLPGNTVNYTFPTRFIVNTNNYSICSFTAVAGDTYLMNDSSCKAVTVNPALLDVAVIQIMSPGDTAASGSVATIKVKIKNFGATAVTSVPVAFQRGSATPVTETWTGAALNTGDEAIYTFNATFTVAVGSQFSLCAYTNLAGDAYPQNNKSCKTVVIGSVGIDEADADGLWLGQNIPNPSNAITNIAYNLPSEGNVVFNMVNMVGQTVYSQRIKADAGRNQLDINVSELPNGVYYYAIEFEGKRLVKKMVVNK